MRNVLENLSFGQRVAEEEIKDLQKYFVETDQWRRIASGEVDVVYGPKGSGKSALYCLLQARADAFFDRSILMVSGENPRGATVFRDLVQDPPTSEREFVSLWKLYVLSLIGDILREYAPDNVDAKPVIRALVDTGLLVDQRRGLSGRLRAALDYVRGISLEGEASIDSATGAPTIRGRISFREPTPSNAAQGQVSVDALFATAEMALARTPLTVWVLMDRLDIAFAESAALEANALRALFKVYLDLLGHDHIKIKIFLRTDIWRRITSDREFREASHITRSTTIRWDKPSLINLVVRRAIQSRELLDFCGIDTPDAALGDEQSKLLGRLLPDQVEVGPNKPKAFDWILGRTSDGTSQNAPRELIHFLNSAREEEMRLLDLEAADADEETIFSRAALKSALPEVSKVRLEQTLYAEYPDLRSFMSALEEQKTLQRPETLRRIWQLTEEKSVQVAEKLVEIGFFERQGTRESPEYWVPFLYRPALRMIQGTAE